MTFLSFFLTGKVKFIKLLILKDDEYKCYVIMICNLIICYHKTTVIVSKYALLHIKHKCRLKINQCVLHDIFTFEIIRLDSK